MDGIVVDFHVHIFPPHVKADRSAYLARDLLFRSMYESPRARIATAEDLVASMDRAGVDVSVAQGFAWTSQDLCRESNDYLLEAASRYPGRIVPFCTVQPAAGDAALRELERCVQGAPPARGLGEMRPELQGFGREDCGLWDDLARFCGQHGLILLMHASEPVGHGYPGKGGMKPTLIYQFLQRFPAWPTVLAHLGGGLPFYAAMPEVRAAMAQTYVDIAAWPLLYRPEIFAALAALGTMGRVLFGSDYPLQDQSLAVQRLREAPLAPEALAAVLGENAVRLLGLAHGG